MDDGRGTFLPADTACTSTLLGVWGVDRIGFADSTPTYASREVNRR